MNFKKFNQSHLKGIMVIDMNKLNEIVEDNVERFSLAANPMEGAEVMSFEARGCTIIDPLVDESSINTVNPIRYYGKSFLTSDFIKRMVY